MGMSGTALSAAQLNASANTAGTFVYTPTLGTILNAGANQILSVNFSPTDINNFNEVNGVQRLITVTKQRPVLRNCLNLILLFTKQKVLIKII